MCKPFALCLSVAICWPGVADAALDGDLKELLGRSASPLQVGPPSLTVKTFASQDAFHAGDRVRLAVVVTTPPHTHIGSNVASPEKPPTYLSTTLTIAPVSGLRLGSAVFPPDIAKTLSGPGFSIPIRLFANRVVIGLEGRLDPGVVPGAVTLAGKLRYQLCNDLTNVCYPPRDEKLSLAFRVVAADEAVQPTHVPVFAEIDWPAGTDAPAAVARTTQPSAGADGTTTVSQRDLAAKIDEGLASFLIYAAALGLGSLITPCVFPMIPITVSFFTKQSEKEGHRPLTTAGIYCLAIVAVFCSLGLLLAAVVGASGGNMLAQDPWVNLVIGVAFVLFALMLFGLIEVRVPTKLLALTSGRGKGTSIVGVVFMALTFTLVSFTCTTPFVGSVLVMGANTGNWLYPLIGMVAYSAAFAAPFFFLAAFPGFLAKMPRSGAWLNSVKVVMGFLELALAAKFLSNTDLVLDIGVFTHDVVLALWALTPIAIALYLVGVIRFPSDGPRTRVSTARWVQAGAWLALGAYLALGLVGSPLPVFLEAYLPPVEGQWLDNYDEALAQARRSGKPMFLDFTGVTCTNCRLMEEGVFKKRQVAERLRDFVLVRLFTDKGPNRATYARMQQERYGTVELPLYVVQTPDEAFVDKFGFTFDAGRFIAFLEKARDQATARTRQTAGR